MFKQQNFNSQAASDSFAFNAAPDAQGNDVLEINSLLFPPDFAYGSRSQGIAGDPRVGDNVPHDHRHLHLTSPVMGSWNSIHLLPQPVPEINEILIRLNNMKRVFYENLRAIEELVRRMHVASPSRPNSFIPPTINPVTPSDYTGQFELSDFGKLSQDVTDYILPIASSSIAGPGHTKSWTTTPATFSPFESNTDSNNITPHSPIYEIIVDKGVKYFRCGCGHRTKTKGDMTRHHKCLKHSEPSYFCECGKSYTRADALDRHHKTCRHQKRI